MRKSDLRIFEIPGETRILTDGTVSEFPFCPAGVQRVLGASGTRLAPTEAERRCVSNPWYHMVKIPFDTLIVKFYISDLNTTFRTFARAFNRILPIIQQQITSPIPTVSI